MNTIANVRPVTASPGVCKKSAWRVINVSVLSEVTSILSRCSANSSELLRTKAGGLSVDDYIKVIAVLQLELVTVLDMLTDLKYVAKKGEL